MEGKDSQEMLGLGPTDHQAERLSCNIVIRCGFFFLFFFFEYKLFLCVYLKSRVVYSDMGKWVMREV